MISLRAFSHSVGFRKRREMNKAIDIKGEKMPYEAEKIVKIVREGRKIRTTRVKECTLRL